MLYCIQTYLLLPCYAGYIRKVQTSRILELHITVTTPEALVTTNSPQVNIGSIRTHFVNVPDDDVDYVAGLITCLYTFTIGYKDQARQQTQISAQQLDQPKKVAACRLVTYDRRSGVKQCSWPAAGLQGGESARQ